MHYQLLSVVDFEEEVWPILEERCVECHKAPFEQNGRRKEPKAGLRLDGAGHIMAGSDVEKRGKNFPAKLLQFRKPNDSKTL